MPHIGLACKVEDHLGPLGRHHLGQARSVQEVRAAIGPVGSRYVITALAQVGDQVVPHEPG